MHILLLVLVIAGSSALSPALSAAAQSDFPADHAGPQVSVSATIVVIDRQALTRAGVSHLVLGDGRVRLSSSARGRTSRGVRAAAAAEGVGIQAFLDLAREQRWVRSEHTQQVTVLSGSEASISSSALRMDGWTTRTTGPSLTVLPTVLDDGTVHLSISAALTDVAVDGWGYPVDGSPVSARSEIVVGDGEEAVLASGAATETGRRAGLLRFETAEQDREVLITITPRVVAGP